MSLHQKTAIWALTPNGGNLATRIGEKLPDADLYFSENLPFGTDGVHRFSRLMDAVRDRFNDYDAHIFIMSTGIVVRSIARLMNHKTTDPAVLVMDEKGKHVISLLSGHVGGANQLTLKVAELTGSDPVITTATDINHRLTIDEAAMKKGLLIENPEAIKYVSMAIIKGDPIGVHDPYGLLCQELKTVKKRSFQPKSDVSAHLFIDDQIKPLPNKTLILRPLSLVAGMGCNRGTDTKELKDLLLEVMDRFQLSLKSLKGLASVDLKSDEAGLIALGEELELPIQFFSKHALDRVKTIENPSAMVEKHIGIKSVCEAAAILGTRQGQLIVPKQNTKNVTVAIARIPFTS